MRFAYYYSKIITKMKPKTILKSIINKPSYIGSGSWIIRSSIEQNTNIGYDCKIFDTKIGKYCSIGHNVQIGIANHPYHYLSTSPVIYSKKNSLGYGYNEIVNSIVVTNVSSDVWIGSGAYIKAGVIISKGAIIGMNSVLTKDVGPYEIWAGNPAKLIKKRFSEKIIAELMEIPWETWHRSKLESIKDDLLDVESFIIKNRKN